MSPEGRANTIRLELFMNKKYLKELKESWDLTKLQNYFTEFKLLLALCLPPRSKS